MSQVSTVRAVPYKEVKDRVEAVLSTHDAELSMSSTSQDPKKPIESKVPPPYEKLVGKMSNRQIRGELKRVIKKAAFPRTPQAKTCGGRAMFDTMFATIMEIFLDSHERGVSPFPR